MSNNETALYKQRFERECLAKKLAEQIAEDKSRELFIKTQELEKVIVELKAAEQGTALLFQALKAFSSILSLKDLIEFLHKFLNDIVPSDHITIYTIADDLLDTVTNDKAKARNYNRKEINIPDKLQFLKSLSFPTFIDDARLDTKWSILGMHPETVSASIFSMTIQGKVIGYVLLECNKHKVCEQKTSQLMQAIVDEAAIALENTLLFQEMEILSTTDPLTGLNNRRHFEAAAERELLLSLRHRLPLSFFILDIDHFKNVNDTYGHNVGDKVLKEIANTCRSILRITDINVRLGGEELAFLCPNTNIQGTFVLAERMRMAVSELTIKVEDSQIKITVSIGISEVNHNGDSLINLIKRADQALYQAKNNGRNQTVVWKDASIQ
jgi:diguanylate cyclase (GGDEF)-like protein